MPLDSEKRQSSWRDFRKISVNLRNSYALRHVCGIGGPTRTEMCLRRFSLQIPGFRSLRICADLQDFCRSLRICADLQNFCRSLQICADLQNFCRSLQICADLQNFCRSLQICADSKKNYSETQ